MLTDELQRLTLDTRQSTVIDATIEQAFDSLLLRLGPDSVTPDNRPMPMRLEAWPGGRWYRDLGENVGHLWGFVQVIKPPALLEINGPMFMSYAATGHVQFRLEELGEGVELSVHHRALGMIADDHREGVVFGWKAMLDGVKSLSERA